MKSAEVLRNELLEKVATIPDDSETLAAVLEAVDQALAGYRARQQRSKVTAREQLYTTADIAEMFDLSEQTVRKWCREGRIPAKVFGRGYRISRETVDAMKADGI